MKVCHITSAHSRNDTRIFQKQCVTLSKNGHEVILVCCDGKEDGLVNGVTIKSFSKAKLSKKQRFLFLLKNKKIIKYLLKIDADIYQFHDIELIEVGRKLAKKRNVIFDSHENWKGYIAGLLPQNKLFQSIYNSFFDWYYRKILKHFSAVFTVSPNFVRDLKHFTDRVYMVSNYPILESNKLLLHTNKSVSSNNFIYEGTVYASSNQINIVKALYKIKENIKYKIVGSISDKLKKEILEISGANKVELIGQVSKETLNKILLSSCAGFILLNYQPNCGNKEGSLGSNKLFEYMMSGLPVICTDFKLWKELIIDKYKCGICVNPSNVSEIYEAINYIICNTEEAYQMGQRGRQAVLEEFNWERTEKEFINIYSDIYNLTKSN